MSRSMGGLTCKVSVTRRNRASETSSGRPGTGTPVSVLTGYSFRVSPETRAREGSFFEAGIDELGTFSGSGDPTDTVFKDGDIVTVTSPSDHAYINDSFIIMNHTRIPGAGGKTHHLYFRMKKES